MKIAEQLRQNNISEYILFMWGRRLAPPALSLKG